MPTTEQNAVIADAMVALRQAEVALDDGLRRAVGHIAIRELRDACTAHENEIDDVLSSLGLPRGRRWGTGPESD